MNNQETEKNQRYFDLGAILNITTGRLFTNMDDIYEILNFLTQENLYTHQLTRVADEAESYILTLYPELKGVGKDVKINNFDEAKAFVDEQKKIFGDKLPLSPMRTYTHISPVKEAFDLISKKHK